MTEANREIIKQLFQLLVSNSSYDPDQMADLKLSKTATKLGRAL